MWRPAGLSVFAQKLHSRRRDALRDKIGDAVAVRRGPVDDGSFNQWLTTTWRGDARVNEQNRTGGTPNSTEQQSSTSVSASQRGWGNIGKGIKSIGRAISYPVSYSVDRKKKLFRENVGRRFALWLVFVVIAAVAPIGFKAILIAPKPSGFWHNTWEHLPEIINEGDLLLISTAISAAALADALLRADVSHNTMITVAIGAIAVLVYSVAIFASTAAYRHDIETKRESTERELVAILQSRLEKSSNLSHISLSTDEAAKYVETHRGESSNNEETWANPESVAKYSYYAFVLALLVGLSAVLLSESK
jgi:hypothetical protein